MPQHITIPGQGVVEFPDGMSDADISAAIKKSLPDLKPQAAPQAAAPPPPAQAQPTAPQQPQPKQGTLDFWDTLKLIGGHILEGAKQDLTLPGRVYSGETQLNTPQGMGQAVGLGVDIALGRVNKLAKTGVTSGVPSLPPVPEAVTTAQKIFSPESVSPVAKEAAGLVREKRALATRDTLSTEAAMEPFRKTVNQMPEPERLDLLDYIQGRSKGVELSDKSVQPIADTVRDAMKLREEKIKSLPSTDQAQFVEDYLTQIWQNPEKARAAFVGMGKEGSGRFLKKREIPSYREGIAMGLKPLTTDPLEITSRYIKTMDSFLAQNAIVDTARDLGTVKYYWPGEAPEGWAKLNGRLGVKYSSEGGPPMHAYAPEDWTRIYNNFISRGFHDVSPEIGQAYQGLQRFSNGLTSTLLGLSGFHAFTMANESYVSGLARAMGQSASGIQKLFRGQPVEAAKSLGRAAKSAAAAPLKFAQPLLPAKLGNVGKKMEQVYLGRTPGTPDMRRIVDIATKAGGKLSGFRQAPEYEYSAANSYWTSWKRGALKLEAQQALQQMGERPLVGTAKVAAQQVGRVMTTFAEPLFRKYIPRLKNAAIYDNISDWIAENPNAGYDQLMAASRKIVDSVDNRFGEMNSDNIFWNQTLKQSARLGMVSYSWNLGTIREIAGGALKGATKPGRLSLASKDYDPRIGYVIALPIAVGTLNAVYQYLKTGKSPQDMQDLVAPRTGGLVSGIGGHGQVPERARLPGYQKDVFGWYYDWQQELKNKRSSMLSLGWSTIWNEDWRTDPIFNPEGTAPDWLKQYMNYVTQNVSPITFQQFTKGTKQGSQLGAVERFMGVQPATSPMQDPEGYARMRKAMTKAEWLKKQRHDRAQQRQYGGTE